MNSISKRFSSKKLMAFSLLVTLFAGVSFTLSANDEHGSTAVSDSTTQQTTANHHETEEKEFNTGEVIMEHISDAHDWHLWGHTSIHLPVILYTDKGLEVFSSGNFDHGHAIYQGKYYNYKNIHEHVKVVDAEGNVDEAASSNIFDFSITKNVMALFVSIFVLLVMFISIGNAYRKNGIGAPKGLAAWMEPIILFVRDEIARPNLGDQYHRFMPYLLTVFFFIWMNNVLGLVPFFPGGANVTGNIAITLVLALITFVITNLNGTKTYWSHVFTPHVPTWLYPLMIPVEIIGLFTKPFALMIRLFANITAGHILVLSLVCLIFIFKSLAVAGVSVPFVVFISVIEMLVAFIQAFIFTILSALYIGMALEKPHHEGEHH
ncbi:MAG: F0F1 ATP synthase subunit A [Bacteroidota bacterium]